MKPYELTEPARGDLFEIWNYIAEDNLGTADRVLGDIERAMERLAEYPELGHRRPDIQDQHYRYWPIYSYLIVYDPESSPIQIMRVVHGYRDIPNVLG